MLDKLKNLFAKKPEVKAESAPKEPKPKKVVELSAKEKATQAGEPYVAVLNVDVDPNNINNGAFELDWNEIFIARLIKAGYMMKKDDKDSDIIDRWWTQVCRNTVLEVYEQQQADPTNRESDLMRPTLNRRDLGDGRAEIS
jgi:meiotically up-regulated gene 157 (Mug157) protein